MYCHENTTGNDTEANADKKEKREPKPPPIYIYGVTDYKAMVENLAKAVDEETYFTKTLSNNTVRISTQSPETYRKIMRHIQDEKIVYHMYQIKQDRAYRVLIRDMHHSI
jgi:hypothetical protein